MRRMEANVRAQERRKQSAIRNIRFHSIATTKTQHHGRLFGTGSHKVGQPFHAGGARALHRYSCQSRCSFVHCGGVLRSYHGCSSDQQEKRRPIPSQWNPSRTHASESISRALRKGSQAFGRRNSPFTVVGHCG